MNDIVTIDSVRGFVDDSGMAMLNAEDVARGFGFTQVKSGKEYVRWETINGYLTEFGFSQHVGKDDFIPENMVYRLGFKASNETAQAFQAKLADEVLPSIRKHGMYATDDTIEQIMNNPEFGIKLLTALKDEREKRKEAEGTVAILSHVNKTYTMTEIAKELNMNSAQQLNKTLASMGVQFKTNGTWVFYSRFSSLGYEEIKQEVLDSGMVIYHRKITQRGREFILRTVREAA